MTAIWKQHTSLSQLNSHRAAGLAETLEIKIVARGSNWLTAEMPVKAKHLQPFGIVHGGSTASLAETVASVAGWLCVDPNTQRTVGLELNINHLKAVKDGILSARATAIHVGRLTQVWQIDIHNQEFKHVSTSRLTITVISSK